MSDLEFSRIVTHNDFDGIVSGAICSLVPGAITSYSQAPTR